MGNFKPDTTRIVKYCSCCNTYIYGEWEIYEYWRLCESDLAFTDKRFKRKLNEYKKEFDKNKDEQEYFKYDLSKCPICGSKITGYDNAVGLDINAFLIKEQKKRFQGVNYNRLVCERLEKLKEHLEIKNIDIDSQIIKQDTIKLRKLVENTFQIESNIYTISTRLLDLYKKHIESKKDADYALKVLEYETKFKIETLEKENEDCEKGFEEKLKDKIPNPPQKPKMPTQPEPPIYLKAYFFNKKSVNQKNEELRKKYEEELALYKEKCRLKLEKYEDEKRTYDELVENITLKKKKELERQRAKNDSLIKVHKETIERAESMGDDFITPARVYNKMVEDEILEAEKALRELYAVRKCLYDSGVIFPKYCNFVAISSFNEYLSSGRCTTLEGANGAYNIYESEIRADRVIEQLSEVVNSLHRIEKNQFLIYSAIQETNEQLRKLNSSMGEAIKEMKEINIQTKDIANSSKVTAYYSRINAYYSKKTAELTNSLGYLVALK